MQIHHIHHHHHYDRPPEPDILGQILIKLEQIMATLEETLAAVQAETTNAESIIALLTGIKAQLDTALGGALTPSQQQRVDAIFAEATKASGEINAAIAANTPAAPAAPATATAPADATPVVTPPAN